MRIVHVVPGMTLGGIETMLVNIANIQSRRGHEVHIFVINKLYDPELLAQISPEVKLHFFNRKVGSKNPLHPLKLSWRLRRVKPDIVHLHHWSIIPFVLPACYLDRTCVTYHSVVREKFSPLLARVKHIFAISKTVQTQIKEILSLDSIVVYNGIKPGDFKKKTAEKDGGQVRFVQVGRLVEWHKGQDLLINAAAKMRRKGFDNFTIDFIGEGESRDDYQLLVEKLGLQDVVTFLGSRSIDYIHEHLSDYDVFVQPSRFEGFGLTITEAMAAQVPVIVSRLDGPSEIVEDDRYGYTFTPGDVNDLADKMELFLTGKADRNKVEDAHERVNNCFNIERTVDQYLQAYKNITKN